jgi:hypothetical protein
MPTSASCINHETWFFVLTQDCLFQVWQKCPFQTGKFFHCSASQQLEISSGIFFCVRSIADGLYSEECFYICLFYTVIY